MNSLHMLYAEWFFPVLIAYLAVVLTYFIYCSFREFNPRAFKLLLATVTMALMVFYFVLPVPAQVQNSFVHLEDAFQSNNSKYNGIYSSITKHQICQNGYVTAYEYFVLKNSFHKDIALTVKIQGNLNGSIRRADNNTYKSICN